LLKKKEKKVEETKYSKLQYFFTKEISKEQQDKLLSTLDKTLPITNDEIVPADL
jgi:hypothetical protein